MVVKETFESPWAVDANIHEGWAWVSTGSELIRLSNSGIRQSVCTLEGFVSVLSTDYYDGSCWMLLESVNGTQAQKISMTGEILCMQNDLNYPVNILSNPVDGGCIIADLEKGIIRLSASGEIMSQFSIFYSPLGLCRG